MKILMAASEVYPYAKTGGLGDVVPALAASLAKLGHEVKIVMPYYKKIKEAHDKHKLQPLLDKSKNPISISIDTEKAVVYFVSLSIAVGKPVTVYFIDHKEKDGQQAYFDRDGLYGPTSETEYPDNPERFSFLCRAVFELCRKENWYPEIIHAHDWQAAMAVVYLKYLERSNGSKFENTASVLTIHNLCFQGKYPREKFDCMGLGTDVYTNAKFEHEDVLNMLKAGLYSADKINAVSPTYANETKTKTYDYTYKLDGVLCERSADYSGIINGIDTDVWNPAKDKHPNVHYDASNMAGKAKAKEALQKYFELAVNAKLPLFGIVARITKQKGFDTLFDPKVGRAWDVCRNMDLQMVILGTGEEIYQNEIIKLQERLIKIESQTDRPANFKAYIGYDEQLSHLIEAGSDFFLMPSRFEPCGLNQMYSLVYGTLPIVHKTGGLADTVENYNEKTGEGTGFMFYDINPDSVYDTIGWAVATWYDRPEQIKIMQQRGMKLDFSWEKSAEKYLALYESALKK